MDYKKLSATATAEMFEQNPDANWDFDALSSNPNITEQIIDKYPFYNWNYIKLSVKPNIKHRLDKYDDAMKKQIKLHKTK